MVSCQQLVEEDEEDSNPCLSIHMHPLLYRWLEEEEEGNGEKIIRRREVLLKNYNQGKHG